MTNGDDIIVIDWNSKDWEQAIERRTEIRRLGGEGDLVLHTGRVLVDSQAAQDDRVRSELDRRGVIPVDRGALVDDEAAAIASELGLALLTVPGVETDLADRSEQLVDTVRTLRAIVPRSASLEHVWVPSGNRAHGDDLPFPTTDPGDIPGAEACAGTALTIYVLDTGIGPKIPFSVDARDVDAEVLNEDNDVLRDHAAGHGTHVAGLIARTAAGARIVARRLLTTPVGMATELDTAKAIVDAGREGANLINCSFGGTTLFDAPPLATERALATLSPGTVVVAAAGNSGLERPHWPAAAKGVIAVGSVGRREEGGEWLRTDFSNYGHWVDCCAPGVAMASTFLHTEGLTEDDPVFDGYATWTGTSFSCPQVTAAIAELAMRDKIEPRLAAYRLVHDPARPRIGPIGTLVEPDRLP